MSNEGAPAAGSMEPVEPIDHAALLAEIDQEVARRRASGDLPADFERELDLVFARFAPVHAIGDDFGQVLERAESSTFIDVLAPTESSLPVVPHVKRVVRKVITWELRHMAQQVTAFANASVRALRLLAERVDALEEASGALPGAVAGGASDRTPDRDHWAPLVAAAVAGANGRVLHAEADDGWLLTRLGAAGMDVYGVDPVARTPAAGMELREDAALDHLRALPDGALGAVVLSGCVDRLGLGHQRRLAAAARAKVAPGGVVVVIGRDPRSVGRGDPVAADLAPARALHAETWAHLLGGGDGIEVLAGPRPEGLRQVPGAPPDMAANLHRLDALLFPPDSYAVVARFPA